MLGNYEMGLTLLKWKKIDFDYKRQINLEAMETNYMK